MINRFQDMILFTSVIPACNHIKLAELEHDLFGTLGDTYLDRQRSLQALYETSAVVTFAYDHAKVLRLGQDQTTHFISFTVFMDQTKLSE